jgi:DNA adenine methylase
MELNNLISSSKIHPQYKKILCKPFMETGYCKFGKEEHSLLAFHFKNTRIKCLMVIGKTPFIEELYDGYIVESYSKKYKFKIHSGRVDQTNEHLVIKNY